MKFLPCLLLTDAVVEALRNGQLRLQRGQWVRIPGDPVGVISKPSRFVANCLGWLNIVHPTGPYATGTFPVATFQARCQKARAA